MELGNRVLSKRRAKWMMLAILVVLISLGSVFMIQAQKKSFEWGAGRLAASIVNIRVAKDDWPQFFNKLDIYAYKNGFQINRTRIHPVQEQYDVELARQDAAVSAANIRELLDFEFAVYIDPAKGGSQKLADELTASLATELKDIPGIRISQSK